MSVVNHAQFIARLQSQGHAFKTIYDVGASIGNWSLEVQKVAPDARYELFEPLSGRVADVDEQSVLAKLKNATLHPVALSDETRQGEIKVLDNRGVGSSILVRETDRSHGLTIIPCEMSRMDDYITKHGLVPPDFLKLDTQASELKVLKGAVETLKTTKFILLETWMRRVYGVDTPLFHETTSWLYDHGFVLLDMLITPSGRDADGTLRWFDAVYVNKAESKFPARML